MTMRPPPIPVTPIDYASAGAIQLDARAIARIRVGIWFFVAYLAGGFVRVILMAAPLDSSVTFFTGPCFSVALAAAAVLIAPATRHPADPRVFRYLLPAVAIPYAVVAVGFYYLNYTVFNSGPVVTTNPMFRLFTIVAPVNSAAISLLVTVAMIRLVFLGRIVNARSLVWQLIVLAALLLAFQVFYFSYAILLYFVTAAGVTLVNTVVAFIRAGVCTWAVAVCSVLATRLRDTGRR